MISKDVLEQLEFSKVLQLISKYCYTEPGKEKILTTVPFDSAEEALSEGELVTQAKEILIKAAPPPIEYLPNLEEDLSISKIEGSVLSSKKMLQILELAVISRNLFQFIKTNNEIAPMLGELSASLFVDKVFEHHITSIINENGEIKDNASKKLKEIRQETIEKKDELIKAVNKLMKDLTANNLVREDYVTLRDGRIVVPIKSEHKRHIKGFIHSESSTGQTIYIEPEETLILNNAIVSLYFAERREIERILKELTSKIGLSSEKLRNSLKVIAHIDSIFSKANYSIEIIGSYPSFDSSKNFFLKDIRHPLLISRLGKEKTVQLSLEVDKARVILVTGPNAGGKTVALKTIALNSVMVQSGIHISSSPDSNFHFFNNILLDIGDKQSIEDDLSTFSSHLSNIYQILETADSNSLIILDEIGTGTEPSAGSAIAAAILFILKDKKSFVFAATHHGNLKLLAQTTEGFQNSSMEFDTKELKPTYVFRQGVPGSSYAFEIAKRIGFKESFLSLANQYIETGQDKIEKMLMDVESKSFSLQEKLNEFEVENTRLKELTSLYQKRLDVLEKQKKEILKRTKDDADKYLRDVNKAIEGIIKDIKENKAGKESILNAQTVVKNLKESSKNLYKEESEIIGKEYIPKVGDFAVIKNTQTKGRIIDLSKDNKTATLNVGALKIQVKSDELIPSEEVKDVFEPHHNVNYEIEKAEYRIDIRGDRAEEAEKKIIKFIDTAFTSNMDRVEILHGKGTGILKKIVKEVLSSHEKVKNYYYAPVEYGGDGITIVELK